MWSLKFLSGPKAGKEILLPQGLFILGREKGCQIRISDRGISRKHVQLVVNENHVMIEDLNSENGTFINGKKIHSKKIKSKDRVALYNIVFEITKKQSTWEFPGYGMFYPPPNQNNQSLNKQTSDIEEPEIESIKAKSSLIDNIKLSIKSYVNNVILPGVYKLAEWMEFRFIVASFVVLFIVLVTVLSAFPLISILRSSIEQESRLNAENIATTLAEANKPVLKKGLQTATTVDYALRRPKVSNAYIISAIDGRILAPANLAHTYPKNPIIHKARKLNTNTVEKLNASSVIAIVPISFYNPETDEGSPRAYSIVIYKLNSLVSSSSKVVSLLIQTLLITCIVGAILFFLLINLIEFPIRSLNRQLGHALKDDKAPSITLNYQSQILTDLCGHINSALNQIALNRMLNQKTQEEEHKEVNRQNEMNNLVEIIGFPSLCINIEEESVASLNNNFTEQIGFSEILNQPLSSIANSELKDHLLSLVEQGKGNPQDIAFGEITLNHMPLQSTCQFIMGKSSPAYAVVTFMSAEQGAS